MEVLKVLSITIPCMSTASKSSPFHLVFNVHTYEKHLYLVLLPSLIKLILEILFFVSNESSFLMILN